MVERRWRLACDKESQSAGATDSLKVVPYLPTDSELAAAFIDRKKREGSVRGFGIRTSHSVKGSDSWVDDPITRHIISLSIDKEEQGESHFIWPVILHVKGPFYLLALPLVEPHHLKTYARMCNRSDCGNTIGEDENLSSLLLDLPSITGYGHLWWYIQLVTL